ncbi:MAG: PfkB family carbohydrate kinase, partial [Chitinophagaceae bacterium]
DWNPTQVKSLKEAHRALFQQLQHKISLFTLSEHGMFAHDTKKSWQVPAHVRAIADVSGAGDTVISVFTLFYALSGNVLLSLQAANLAGGLVCEKPGVVPIDRKELENEFLSKFTA